MAFRSIQNRLDFAGAEKLFLPAQRSYPGQEVSKKTSRGARNGILHRVDHVTVSRFFLACAAKCHEICCPHDPPSLSPLLQAQNIASPKWLPTTYAPGLSKTAACSAYCMDLTTNTDGLPPSCSPLPSLLQHANRPYNFLTQPSLNYLSPPEDHLPHARFCSHFQLVSRLYIAVLAYASGLSSL
jgi:hypothetical protein